MLLRDLRVLGENGLLLFHLDGRRVPRRGSSGFLTGFTGYTGFRSIRKGGSFIN
jgi:hypothetical protein